MSAPQNQEIASYGLRRLQTPMHPPETHAFLAALHPMGRMAEMQEIADAVLYLEKAGFVTGEVLHVDGGAHAGR